MTDTTESQAELAYVRLESLIVTLKLKPGAQVNERQLIDLAGFGRTPVREAVQRLNWQGLIAIRPRSGMEISHLDRDEHRMILEVRRQLEPMAARQVAASVSQKVRGDLIALTRDMSECSVTGDCEGFLAADKRFDLILEANCPNRFIAQALAPLRPHSRRFWFASSNPERLEQSVTQHVQVIRAILDGQADRAEAAMARLVDGLSDMAGAPTPRPSSP